MGNYEKMNDNKISEVSGGWFANFGTLELEDGSVEEHLDVYGDNGNYLGKVCSFDAAKSLAQGNGYTIFQEDRSDLGVFSSEYR